MTTTTIILHKLIADSTPLASLAGTRVRGVTSDGTAYVGTVSADRDPYRTGNIYVVIDVDGGGWVRSDDVLTIA